MEKDTAGPGPPSHTPGSEDAVRRRLEAADGTTDSERLEVLEEVYRDLEGALEQ